MIKTIASVLLIFSSLTAFADSKVYSVKGMHCEDCAKSIEAKVCATPGIDTCKVEMGSVTVSSKKPLDDAKITKAVAAAGHYTVTGSKAVSKIEAAKPEAAPATTEAPAIK